MNSFDARVRYTKMVIENNFLELLQEKPVAKITVTELCQKAQINRATFYKHYLDVPDLLEKLEEKLFDQIRDIFRNHSLDFERSLLNLMEHTRKEGMRFMVLGTENGDPNLMAKTFRLCYENAYPIVERNLPQMKNAQREMLYQFMSQGAGAILTYWIQDDMRMQPEEVVKLIMKLCIAAVDGLQK